MAIRNVCVIGNDGRMDYVAQAFYDMGYDVYRDLEHVSSESIIVLPPPVGEQMTKTIMPYLEQGQIIYGGVVSNRLKHECELLDIQVFDYLKWDQVTAENARLTAKGIIREAIALKAVLEESDCLVTGYGFCGKALADALKAVGARVDVMVRKKELAGVLEGEGYGFVDMNNPGKVNLEKYSYVFNTVPAMVLNDEMLNRLSNNVMIFDIASGSGGTDFEYCREHDLFAMQSLGIPGKEYPIEAGEIISTAIMNNLRAMHSSAK